MESLRPLTATDSMSDDGSRTIGDNEGQVNKSCPFPADNEIFGTVFKLNDGMAAKQNQTGGDVD